MNGIGMMEQIVCAAPGELCLGQAPVPTPDDNDVLLRVRRIGICGTACHATGWRIALQ